VFSLSLSLSFARINNNAFFLAAAANKKVSRCSIFPQKKRSKQHEKQTKQRCLTLVGRLCFGFFFFEEEEEDSLEKRIILAAKARYCYFSKNSDERCYSRRSRGAIIVIVIIIIITTIEERRI